MRSAGVRHTLAVGWYKYTELEIPKDCLDQLYRGKESEQSIHDVLPEK